MQKMVAEDAESEDLLSGGGWDGDSSSGGGIGGGSGSGTGSSVGRKPVPIGTKIGRISGIWILRGGGQYKKPFYRVVYPDGDSEQLLGKELRPLIKASRL